MAMCPELEHAVNANASALEMIKIFTKHYSGVREGDMELSYYSHIIYKKHNDPSFWDTWTPLLGNLHRFKDPTSPPASEPFLRIHKGLTREIISWLCDSQRRSNVYLIAESRTRTENVTENYRADAIATICYEAQRFGLPLRDSPLEISDTFELCTVLGAYYAPFRRLYAKALIDYSEIFQLSTRTRLKKFILEPWKTLQGSHPQYIDNPPVIVLRCPHEDHAELFHSICELASSPHASPLLWIISIDPKFALPIHDCLDPIPFRYTQVPICYKGALADTELYLRHRFGVLRRNYREIFDEHEVWPTEEQMSHLARIFSGVFDSIDVVDKFVDWEGDGGPKVHLETFLAYMVDAPSPSEEHPYRALDHFYTRAFAAIPPDLLVIVTRLLSVFHCGHFFRSLTAFQLSCLLSLAQDTVLNVLPRFCRWAVRSSIPSTAVYYHGCPFFRDFLDDMNRSRHFYIRTRKSEFERVTYRACLRVLSHFPNPITAIKPPGRFDPKTCPAQLDILMDNAFTVVYDFGKGSSESPPEWTLFRCFDFRCLAYHILIPAWFSRFLIKLYAWDKNSSPSIVRVEPAGVLDRQFIDKCEGQAEPLELKWLLEQDDSDLLKWPHPVCPKYVLLGFEAETVLVLQHPKNLETGGGSYSAFTIYTSTMLDDM